MDDDPGLKRRLAAEGLGSFFLFATVIGSGIMAEHLSRGNDAVALLGNTIATGAILFVLIAMLAPISGAHMNPAVTLVMAARRALRWRDAGPYIVVQLGFGILGAWAAHLMFDLPTLQLSVKARTGLGQWTGEAIATFGLILTIIGTVRHRPALVPASVALYIVAAYWFTSSTSFANPAITIARSLSDSFAGIAPANVPAFIAAQLLGAALAAVTASWLFPGGGEADRIGAGKSSSDNRANAD
jgi:glycerol uptake facilitator-like aquaporin